LLAIPMILEMAMEWLFVLGANAVATVALTESVLTLVFGIAMGLSMATRAIVARRIGEKDPEAAGVAAVHAIAARRLRRYFPAFSE
jgi:Na+-driven multidrug efflux pump